MRSPFLKTSMVAAARGQARLGTAEAVADLLEGMLGRGA